MILEKNRIYKSRVGNIYKITRIEGVAYGEHISPGHRITAEWYLDGTYLASKDGTPLDLIEDVTDDYPEEVL